MQDMISMLNISAVNAGNVHILETCNIDGILKQQLA